MVYFVKKIFRITFLVAYLFNNTIVAQSSFRPSDIPGLKLWLRSDTGITLSGNAVDQWKDISGNGNNAFQTTSSIKPTWYVSDTLLNNYPAVKFDGVGSRLETMYIQPNAYSTFIVYAHRNGTNGSFYSTNQSGYPLQRNSIIWPNSNLAPYGLVGDLLNTRNLYVDVHDFLNDNYSTYLNGIYRGGSNAPAPKSGGVFNLGSGGSDPLDGSISEFLIYDVSLSDSFRLLVESYLMSRYAPSVNLGVDKAVCNFPTTLKAQKDYFVTYSWQDASTADSLVVNGPGIYYLTITDIFGRTSSDTINIFQSPPTYTVTLGNDTTICNGQQLTLNAGPSNLTYTWSSSSSTSHSLSVNSQATYSVSVIDCSGNLTIDSIKVTVQSPPAFNFGSNDTIVCYNSGFILNPGLGSPSNLTFDWQDNTNTSTHSVASSGQYYLDVTDNIGCKSTDTINIQIDVSLSAISLGPDISLCAGNLITLTSGASPALTYTWSTSSNNDSLLINTTGQYFVAVTNTNNCVAKDTINVSITGQAPTANFLSSIACINSLVLFINTSIPPLGNVLDSTIWNFGEPLSSSNTSTLTNPSHTYTNTGTYTVSLKVKTDSSCEQTIIKTITVYPVPTATFVSGSSCQNSNTAFVNQSTATAGYSITTSYWNFGDATTSNLTSPNHIFSNFTTYTVKLVVANNAGCKDSVYKPVFVNAEVKASFTNGPACLNNPTLFQSTSIIPPVSTPSYSWNIAGSYANTIAPSKTFTNSGVYNVTLIVDGNNGCTSSITKLVNVYIPPISNFSIPSFCSKDTVTAINLSLPQSGIMSSYNWRLNNISFSAIQSPTLSATTAGNYSVRLTVANSFGCKDSTTKLVTVYPLPLVDFTTNPAAFYYLNEPVTFIPSITNASSYLWNMTGIPTSTLQSPTEVFTAEGSYTVSLNLKDLLGCRNTKTKTISVSTRRLDLAILNITTLKDNDGFMTVVADMANYGSVPITSFSIHYQISDGGNVKETWTGNMNPNSFYVYTFNASSASVQNSVNNITCVDIEKVNGIMDDNTTNNSMCNTLNTSDISVSNPIPNPTDGDITLPITLNRNLDYSIAIYNSVGQILYEETTKKGIEGLNFVTLNTSSYARGCYIIKVMIDEKIFIKKFIRISLE